MATLHSSDKRSLDVEAIADFIPSDGLPPRIREFTALSLGFDFEDPKFHGLFDEAVTLQFERGRTVRISGLKLPSQIYPSWE